MNTYEKDEILEELWKIKDDLAANCGNNMGKMIKKIKEIAAKQKLTGKEVDLRQQCRNVR